MIRSSVVLFAAVIFITGQDAEAQYFERTYPGLNLSSVGNLDNTIDSGFIFCGNQDGGFMMKLDAMGNPVWTIRDTSDLHSMAAVIQDGSGNLNVIGSGASQAWNSEAVLATYDASGTLLSHVRIPPVNGWGTWGTTIIRSPDRQLFHYCYYEDGFSADNYFSLDNTDVIGGDMTSVGLNSIAMDNQGNYYAAANLAFDLDSFFNWRNNVLVLTSNHFPHRELFYDTEISSAAITGDGNVLVAGLYDTLGLKYLRLMKFDTVANLMWDAFIADTNIVSVSQVSQTGDGGFAVLCAGNDGNVQHISFLKVDGSGNPEWKQHFYGNGTALPLNFRILDDGFVIFGNAAGDPYVIRTDNLGRVLSTGVTPTMASVNTINIYPNPSGGIFTVSANDISDMQITLCVYDLAGRIVFNSRIYQTLQEVDLTFLTKGVYQFKFATREEELKTGKFVIE